ncbi:hypothetical protein Mgra_00005587 [Meloidogyne graminicola]|uniref:Uncharacterized protein n=1 Tax=Meloidogyne graminicola TaxID=189291 RepID=A0A8S9ZNJ6_9BILA|nr:hypothetical protein Mgra_00005587 [Meloidogyne graminicola]
MFSIITTSLVLFIYLNIKIINAEPTVEQCNKIWSSETIYNYTECSCSQDLKICKYSLQIHLICNEETIFKYFINLKTCNEIYSDCSLKENNECKIGMCNCFNFLKNKILKLGNKISKLSSKEKKLNKVI